MLGMLATTASEYQPLAEELWRYFYDTYLNPSEYYGNLNLTSADLWTIRILIFGLCVGLSLAAFAAAFNKRVLGDIVRKIIAKQAFSPETAVTLEELGIEGKPIAHFAIKRSTSLRRVVKCCEEEMFEADQDKREREHKENRKKDKSLPAFKRLKYKINPYSDTLYIPEKDRYMADVKFEKKGTTWVGACVFSVVMAVVFVGLMVALPQILSLLNEFAGAFGDSPDNIF